MRQKNNYGDSTAQKCYFCEKTAITYNKEGIPCCKNCKTRISNLKCPICKEKLEIRKGKSTYFHCYKCNLNFSISKIVKYKKL